MEWTVAVCAFIKVCVSVFYMSLYTYGQFETAPTTKSPPQSCCCD